VDGERVEVLTLERRMAAEKLAAFTGQNYLNLETLRKNGTPVATPVWFAEADEVLYVYSQAESGKMKRIRNNPRVRIAPCDMRGNVTGAWVPATAHLIEGDDARRANDLLNQKYWFGKRLLDILAMLRIPRRPRFYIAIRVEEQGGVR
jgi:PPOX class probable F420-dependent enzyme